MNLKNSKIEAEACVEPAHSWILPMRKNAALNAIVLTVTAATVVAFTALFAAQA